ncbi:hypothetical protein RIF29_41253 [Crotalaria pallida]|uniref:Uncharacterized protein n=1 Tax=Crotalaria pallida TaxID=3830 RepID=A0AAN9EA73_CROPI
MSITNTDSFCIGYRDSSTFRILCCVLLKLRLTQTYALCAIWPLRFCKFFNFFLPSYYSHKNLQSFDYAYAEMKLISWTCHLAVSLVCACVSLSPSQGGPYEQVNDSWN